MLLAGDIGGTKTDLGIFRPGGPHGNDPEPVDGTFRTFSSAGFPEPESLLRHYMSAVGVKVEKAVFAVAGPVEGGQARITNLHSVLSEDQLRKALDIPHVRLINDLEATAYAVPFLAEREKHTLNEGRPSVKGTIAVIAPGTGLGESFLTWDGSCCHAHATEGSHVDFAPTSALEVKLLRHFLSVYEHVSYERVCSGMGIPNIYSFLKDAGEAQEPAWLTRLFSESGDPAAVIVNNALDSENRCEICRLTLDMFVSILGAEAGNLALKVMSRGGVYLGGGISPRITGILGNGLFMKSFRAKGRMSDIVSEIPVHIILNPHVTIYGAARFGLDLLSTS